MSRCIMVLGTGRSGTSAVAGVLHHLGVHMGDSYNPPVRSNVYGTFEDEDFFRLTREILTGEKTSDAYIPVIQKRNAQHEIWGVKDPSLASTAHYIWPYLEDVRIIFVRRPRHECINSYMRAYYSGRIQANKWYDDVIRSIAARALEFDGPILDVEYNALLEDPSGEVSKIAQFAFEGLEIPGRREFNNAIGSIQPKQDRSSTSGFGKVAVGMRMAKSPEALFVIDWTAFVTTGLRGGDTILMPQAFMPAHHAASKLAKDFLLGDKDSLLMVDDDHTFDPDSLHRMRENPENWQYDAVSALTVRRDYDMPTPVFMLFKDQPDYPDKLAGDYFHGQFEINIGRVMEVDAVGFGFTLIKRHVLEAMLDEKWGVEYTYQIFKYGPGRESDDIPFSRRCRELGFRMAVDTNVQLGHVVHYPLTYNDYLDRLEEMRRKGEIDG